MLCLFSLYFKDGQAGDCAMNKGEISGGVVHKIPTDLKNALISKPEALTTWEDITPLARNEWICWIESAKKSQQRKQKQEDEELNGGVQNSKTENGDHAVGLVANIVDIIEES